MGYSMSRFGRGIRAAIYAVVADIFVDAIIWSPLPNILGTLAVLAISIVLGLYGLEQLENDPKYWSLPYALGYSLVYFLLNFLIISFWGLLTFGVLGYSVYRKIYRRLGNE